MHTEMHKLGFSPKWNPWDPSYLSQKCHDTHIFWELFAKKTVLVLVLFEHQEFLPKENFPLLPACLQSEERDFNGEKW